MTFQNPIDILPYNLIISVCTGMKKKILLSSIALIIFFGLLAKKTRANDMYGNGEPTTQIIVDKKSFLYLVGTTLEYSGGLNGKGFVFNNPNANRTCGCGESFSL